MGYREKDRDKEQDSGIEREIKGQGQHQQIREIKDREQHRGVETEIEG